jgi:hypothetical protein
MDAYVAKIRKLENKFYGLEFHHVLRADNQAADEGIRVYTPTDNPLYCPYHRYVGHVIEDCVAFKEWLQRAIDEKRLAIPPDAVNPDFHAVNTITMKMDTASGNDNGWVPLAQVEHRSINLELSQEMAGRSPNAWQTVTCHELPPRHAYQRSGCRNLHSIDEPLYRWHDLSRRHMPPRFVPKSQGNESFPRRGRILPTLEQFIP